MPCVSLSGMTCGSPGTWAIEALSHEKDTGDQGPTFHNQTSIINSPYIHSTHISKLLSRIDNPKNILATRTSGVLVSEA